MLVAEPVQIQLHGTPGMCAEQIGEKIGQLLHSEIIDLTVKVLLDATHGSRVGFYGLGLQTLELQVLQMLFVILLECCL